MQSQGRCTPTDKRVSLISLHTIERALKGTTTRMLDYNRRLVVISAHASSVVIPIVGPAVVLLICWRDRFVRRHSAVALLFSLGAMTITSVGSKLLGGGLVFFITPLGGLILVTVLNIQRVNRGEGPLLLQRHMPD